MVEVEGSWEWTAVVRGTAAATRDEEEFVSYTLALAADEPGLAGTYVLTGTSSVPEQFIKLIHLAMKLMRIVAMACRQVHPHE